jgi:hypothetical protein
VDQAVCIVEISRHFEVCLSMNHARVVRKDVELSWWYCRSPGLVVLRADLGGVARAGMMRLESERRQRLRGRVWSCWRLTRCREASGTRVWIVDSTSGAVLGLRLLLRPRFILSCKSRCSVDNAAACSSAPRISGPVPLYTSTHHGEQRVLLLALLVSLS